LLVGEGVPAVHGEHQVRGGISHRQVGRIGLEKMDIGYALFRWAWAARMFASSRPYDVAWG
jgi:hypothetical protein